MDTIQELLEMLPNGEWWEWLVYGGGGTLLTAFAGLKGLKAWRKKKDQTDTGQSSKIRKNTGDIKTNTADIMKLFSKMEKIEFDLAENFKADQELKEQLNVNLTINTAALKMNGEAASANGLAIENVDKKIDAFKDKYVKDRDADKQRKIDELKEEVKRGG